MIRFENELLPVGKIICVGRNYVEHIQELNNEFPPHMVLFNKPASTISQELFLPSQSCRFEGELCFLMNKTHIKGIGFGLDLTLDKMQNELKAKGLPWERAKAFKNSVTFSHFIELKTDVNNLSFKLFINDELIQFADIELMIYKPASMIEQADDLQGLEENDIIMTGTPKGVGYFNEGDVFYAQIFDDKKQILDFKWVCKKTF